MLELMAEGGGDDSVAVGDDADWDRISNGDENLDTFAPIDGGAGGR